jgi:molybdopterin converting factor small subunit
MPRVVFTANLRRHLAVPEAQVSGVTVREALEAIFATNPRLRGYVLDDQGGLREHVVVFVDGARVGDRRGLRDAVDPSSEVYVMQALSGGAASGPAA